MNHCPSCQNHNINVLEKIMTSKLVWLYKRMSINTSDLFRNIESLDYCECNSCKLRYFDPVVSGDNDFYGQLQSMEWYYLHDNKTEYEFSSKLIKPTDKVLDVGSGRGVFASHITCAFYQGLDTSTKAIELAKKDGRNVIGETIERHAAKFKNYYDVVVAFQVLEHVSNVNVFFRCCVDSLKNGGHFIIAVPNNDSFLQYATNNALDIPPHHQLHWNERSLKFIANKYSLEVVSVYKEQVTNIHKQSYLTTMIMNKLRRIFNMKYKIVDNSIRYRILCKFASILAKVFRKRPLLNSTGQTIIIVLKKPMQSA